MKHWRLNALLASLALAVVVGCAKEEQQSAEPSAEAAPPDATYLAATEPDGAVGVGKARQSAQDGEEVVLVGRIGGDVKPFVEGIAAFSIVDPKVPHCAPEEGCPTPWDYCCTQDQVKDNIATIKIVNGEGKTVMQDADQLLGVKPLDLVVIEGKAQRDENGNLSVLADQVFVKK